MASKRNKPGAAAAAAASHDIDELFEGLGDDSAGTAKQPAKSNKPTTAASKAMADQDILAELEDQLNTAQEPSRPHTPRIKETTAKPSPARRAAAGTPPPPHDDKSAAGAAPRKSTDSARSLRASFTPSATSSEPHDGDKKGFAEQQSEAAAGGGWWGGIFATASAAMRQAEAAVKEIQQTDEAKRWADQVRGNVGALRGLGDELRHRAIPTFTNILHTLAPPISSHERLLIHITHDMVGYPSLDPLVHGVFSRVMAQVEGGDLLVVQRGQESSGRRHSSDTAAAGWRDGPWWRQADAPRDLGLVKGLTEGTKLCRASADAYSTEYFAAHGGVEQARVRATEPLSESNPVRSSDLFLSVQAVTVDADRSLFAGGSAAEKEKEASAVGEPADELVCFAVYILDSVHEIEYASVSQAIPAKWVRWLDAPSPLTPASADEAAAAAAAAAAASSDVAGVPDDIRDIVEGGAVDPREWVAEWVEEVLGLAVGVVAQRYVARRMGVGDGGFGKGKRPMDDVVLDGGGEAARAGLI